VRVLQILFCLSGVAGLIYQVVWSRLLSEVFGVTVYAVTTVLATFLAGLALGGVVLGRVADRRSAPLRLYGWLEIGIGATGLLGAWTVRALDPLHVWAANRYPADSLALIAVRALLAAVVILPPTFLMGGTLPAMTRVFVDRLPRLGRELSTLYAVNTFGAVLGTLAAGFVLMRLVGVHTTLAIAVAINLAVGAASLLLAHRPGPETAAPRPSAAATRTARAPTAAPGIGLLVVMALSGFASLGLEVLWTRALVLTMGTATYAFATMLASFLVGIAIGSLVARRLVDRIRDLRRCLGWIQLGIAASTLATLPALRWIMDTGVADWLEALGGDWVALIGGRFGVSFLIMLAPTILIGTTFPLAGRMWTRHEASLAGHVGEVYGANTLGNILGAAVTGFVLLPAVGLQKGIVTLAALNLAGAAWGLWWPRAAGEGRHAPGWRAALPVAGVVGCALALLRWQPPPFETPRVRQLEQVLYYREDAVATVSVYQDRYNLRQRSMQVDGIRIGMSYRGVDEKQQALAHFPFLLMPRTPPRTVLSIGLGTGILIGEVARHPSVQAIDCVEIAPGVIEGARLFDAFNGGVLDDPRVRVINDDGVNFLRRSAARWDAIIADEKSRTGHAGNAVFFSKDYYTLCSEHLSPGGIMIQWVPLDVPNAELATILRSFASVFPHTYVWVAPPQSCFLVGSARPLTLDIAQLDTALAEPAMAHLWRYGWRDAYSFASLLIADRASLASWLGRDGALNTLEHPVLEFYSPQAHAQPVPQRIADNLEALAAARRARAPDIQIVGADPTTLEAYGGAALRLVEASALLQRSDARGLAWLEEALAMAPQHGPLRDWAARAFFEAGAAERSPEQAAARYTRAIELDPELVEAYGNLAGLLIARRDLDGAIQRYREALAVNPDDARVHYGLGVALAMQRLLADATIHFRHALRINTQYAQAQDALRKALELQQEAVRRQR
jgi:spermidine synthase